MLAGRYAFEPRAASARARAHVLFDPPPSNRQEGCSAFALRVSRRPTGLSRKSAGRSPPVKQAMADHMAPLAEVENGTELVSVAVATAPPKDKGGEYTCDEVRPRTMPRAPPPLTRPSSSAHAQPGGPGRQARHPGGRGAAEQEPGAERSRGGRQARRLRAQQHDAAQDAPPLAPVSVEGMSRSRRWRRPGGCGARRAPRRPPSDRNQPSVAASSRSPSSPRALRSSRTSS